MGGSGEEEDIVFADQGVEMTVDVGKVRVDEVEKSRRQKRVQHLFEIGVRQRRAKIMSRRRERCHYEKMKCRRDY